MLAACSVPTSVGDLASAQSEGDGEAAGVVGTTEATVGPDQDTEVIVTTLADTMDVDDGSSSGDPLDPPVMGAYAIRFGDIPNSSEGTDTSASSDVGGDDGGGPDDNALHVTVNFSAESCENPRPDTRCNTWAVSFTMAPDQQMVGTFDLDALNGFMWENGDPITGPNDCSGGGGSFSGQVTIDTLDDTVVRGRFDNIEFSPEAMDLEGLEFVAERC